MEKRNLSVKEAAKYSGLSVHTIYKKVAAREITILKLGSRVLIPKDKLDEYLKRHLIEGSK